MRRLEAGSDQDRGAILQVHERLGRKAWKGLIRFRRRQAVEPFVVRVVLPVAAERNHGEGNVVAAGVQGRLDHFANPAISRFVEMRRNNWCDQFKVRRRGRASGK